MKNEIISSSDLPTPRLQLRWEKMEEQDDRGYTWFCHYELVMLLGPYDVRHNECDEYSGRSAEVRIKMPGGTKTDIEDDQVLPKHEYIRIPFRDGAHIKWDAYQFKMRAFVVYANYAQEIAAEPMNRT